VLVFVKQFIIL